MAFRKKIETRDQILVEKARKHNLLLYMTFTDYRKAFLLGATLCSLENTEEDRSRQR